MNETRRGQTSFWKTVWLLLGSAQKRAAGRRTRQRQILQQRAGKTSRNWGSLGFVAAIFFMAVLNIGAAFVVSTAVKSGQRTETEHRGKIVVSYSFLDEVRKAQADSENSSFTGDQFLAPYQYSAEANRIVEKYGGTKSAVEQKLNDAVVAHGSLDLIGEHEAAQGLSALEASGPLPAMLGSLSLFWWAVMLIFQGEGLELDLQRRGHPMWEWLFSHPVPPGAIFLSEMFSPIAANPIYWSGPLFAGVLYGLTYEPFIGFAAAILVGIPITIAAASLGKALEIAVILRFPPRSRGAIIGFMSWIGYASMMGLFIAMFTIPKIVTATSNFFDLFTALPWPWLRLFLGGQLDGSFSFLSGIVACWIVAAVTIAASVRFSVWGAQQGLSGNFARADVGPKLSPKGSTDFGKEPLYRKEFLWFIRDRSAIVQAILVPLTVAGLQIFNLRGLLSRADGAWNYLCGGAILFGTYFLWILGPKSLASEGTALWISLTWPRGLESLLKAKAWLWSMISSALVALVLCYAAFLFPTNIWQITLVGIGWFIFGRSMAEKSVTLVTVTSSSGEPEKIPWGRRGAAQLGMLTFSIGVLTQQWNVAIIGIVYSYLTAAAMWQNFRARLPYLYDPWSEVLPPAPTLMHAMVAISLMVEGMAVLSGLMIVATGPGNMAVIQAMSYAISAIVVSIGAAVFLRGRGVSSQDVWNWRDVNPSEEESQSWWRAIGSSPFRYPRLLFIGGAGGLSLGLLALAYLALLSHIPAATEILRKSQEQMAKIENLRLSYAVTAIVFAPVAEESLSRVAVSRSRSRMGRLESGVWQRCFFRDLSSPAILAAGCFTGNH